MRQRVDWMFPIADYIGQVSPEPDPDALQFADLTSRQTFSDESCRMQEPIALRSHDLAGGMFGRGSDLIRFFDRCHHRFFNLNMFSVAKRFHDYRLLLVW